MLNAPVPGIDREQRLRQLMADHGSSVLLATVRTRLHRAKKLLHPMLKGWYFDE